MANGNLSLLKYLRNKVSLVMNVRTTKITRTNKSMPKKKMRYCLSLASFSVLLLAFVDLGFSFIALGGQKGRYIHFYLVLSPRLWEACAVC